MTNYKFNSTAIEEKLQTIENGIDTENTFSPIILNELMTKNFPEVKWLVEQLIPIETIVAISGIPSSYKTWLVLDLAVRVAKGEILFDRFMTSQTGVLIIDEETGERWIKERVLKLHDSFDLPIYFLSKTGFKLTEETVKQLASFSKEKGIGLIIFDSLLRIHTARDENDAVEMAKVFRLFQQLTKEGITVVFTHHHRKEGLFHKLNPAQDMRGSSDILAAVDCHIAIERQEDVVIRVFQQKLRQEKEIKPFNLNIIQDDQSLRLEYAGEIDEVATIKMEFKEAIIDLLKQQGKPMYKKEIFEILKADGIEGGHSTFKSTIDEMVQKGELYQQRGERNKMFCSLTPFSSEDSQAIKVDEKTDGQNSTT